MVALKMMPMRDDDHRPTEYLSLFLTGLFSHLFFEVPMVLFGAPTNPGRHDNGKRRLRRKVC